MKIFNSIRWRLQIWYGLILVVVLAGFGVTAYQLERGRQFRRIDDGLQRRFNFIADTTRPHPHPPDQNRQQFDRPGPEGFPGDDNAPDQNRRGAQGFHLPPQAANQVANLFDTNDPNDFYFIVLAHDGHELARSTNAPPEDLQRIADLKNIPTTEAGHPKPPDPAMEGNRRWLLQALPPGQIVLVGCSVKDELAELRLVAWTLVGVGAGILVLGLLGGWWIASRAIRPIQDISSAAAKISAGDLSQRINTAETESELGKLAAVLNSTFARLETSFAQQQQFTSDAAHELRTPVSVMLTQTQMALNRERSEAEYRETLNACQRSAQRMRRLIESLLELARLDAGQEQMKHLPFDCAATVHECVEAIHPLADERGVVLMTELGSAKCVGDSERISQVVTNLLTNAIQYNRIGGQVRVGLKTENGLATLTISDNGIGIPAPDLPHVFERFYRGDKARATANGHSGLGLAICKAIVEAHSGTIEVASEPDRGTTFIVRLPAAA